jgi:peptidoglycan/LPS O-acetylase OafA/YrhL
MIRYRLFEIWRFAAALLIMLYHFAHFAPAESLWVKNMLESFRLLLDLFFIISGYLIFQRYGDEVRSFRTYVSYLGRRLVRLYPLHLITLGYFVAVGIAVALGLTRTGGGRDLFQWDMLIPNLLLIQAWGVSQSLSFNFVSWSLSAEWFAYLALPVVIFAYRRGGTGGLALLVALSYAALEAMAAMGIMPFPSWVLADTWGAYRVFADFALGALLSVLVARSPWRIQSRLAAWAALVAACTLMALDFNLYLSLAVLALAVFLAGLVETNAPERFSYPSFLQPAAVVSFGIYLWHPVTENLFLAFVWNKFIASQSSALFFVYIAGIMLLTVLVAIASFRFFETPMAAALSHLLGLKKRPAPAALAPA